MKLIIAAVIATLCLVGCSVTLPVRGQVQNSEETFTGTATGGMSGSGSLTIVSNKGAACKGEFVYAERRRGEGIFTCNDGRTGPFQFVSSGMQGAGYGELGGQRFTFSFGKE